MLDLCNKPFYLNEGEINWINSHLSKMSLEDKVGQLFCIGPRHATCEEWQWVTSILKPGGVMYRPLPLELGVNYTNMLQMESKIPLLIAANLEKGGNGAVTSGTIFGSPMQVAATQDALYSQKLAKVCALEGAAVGINWSFAPIIDIDYNYENPVTNTRTFGNDPETVKVMGVNYIETLQSLGLSATIKHFPGDGRDCRDQHLVTSINDYDCETWDNTYGKIYHECIDAGVKTVMVGHIMQPAYSRKINPTIQDSDILPASLSKELMDGLLRKKLGFNGLIVTDATSSMAGFTIPMPRKIAVPYSIAAGADIFLFTRNLAEDYFFMLDGVKNNILTMSRLDEAVTRILALKASLHLNRTYIPLDINAARKIVGCQNHMTMAKDCADRSVTLVKEQQNILPLSVSKYPKVLLHKIERKCDAPTSIRSDACEQFQIRLTQEGFNVECAEYTVDYDYNDIALEKDTIGSYDLIIYVANLATNGVQTTVRIEWNHPRGINCPHYITSIPTIFVSLENPYHLLDVPRIKTYINTYCSSDFAINAVIEKLMGRSDFIGKNPIDPFCGKWDTRL